MSALNVGNDDIVIVDSDVSSDSDVVDLTISPMRRAVATQRQNALNSLQNLLAVTPGVRRFVSPVASPADAPVNIVAPTVEPVLRPAAPTGNEAPSIVAEGSNKEEKDSGKDTKQPSQEVTRQSSTLSVTVIPKDLPDPTVQPEGAPSLEKDPSHIAALIGKCAGVSVVDPKGKSAKASSVDVDSKGEGDSSVDPKVHRFPEESVRRVVTPGGDDGPNVEPKPDPRDGPKVGEVPPPPPQPSDLSLQQQLKALQESHESNDAREKKLREREASLFKLTQGIAEQYERVKERERKNSDYYRK